MDPMRMEQLLSPPVLCRPDITTPAGWIVWNLISRTSRAWKGQEKLRTDSKNARSPRKCEINSARVKLHHESIFCEMDFWLQESILKF